MKIHPDFQQPGALALRSGTVIGIALGVIHSVITIFITQMNAAHTVNYSGGSSGTSSTTTALYLLTPLIWIVGLLIAGTWAARANGKVGTGTLAGLFAGLFAGIIAGFGQVIATALVANQTTSPSLANLLLFSGFAAIFYVMVLAVGAGAGFGALGGLIGQSLSNVRPQPIAQPTYQGPERPYTYAPSQQQPEMPPFPEQ